MSKLLRFRRLLERRRAGLPAGDGAAHIVDVAGTAFAPVAGGAVALGFGGELGLLEGAVRGHAEVLVAIRELEHGVVQRVKARWFQGGAKRKLRLAEAD